MSGATTMLAEWRHVHRLLVVRLDNLGDVLLQTPAFRALRCALPHATITLLASPVGAQVGRMNPDLDDVIVYDAPWVDPWGKLPHDPEREQAMIRQIAAHKFDAAIIFTSFRQSALPAAMLCYLAGIPLRAAASVDGSGSLLTTRHKHPERLMHEVERSLGLIAALGVAPAELELVLEVPDDGQWTMDGRITSTNRRLSSTVHHLIVLHPGCSMPARTYPWQQYAEIADLLVERLDATVVLTGGPDEAELVHRVRNQMRHEAAVSAGELSFHEFCALIQRADLMITNNTGPMHIAAALQTPVVALFALTNPPEQWGPWRVPHRILFHDVPCRICYSRVCPYGHECLSLVSPEQVFEASCELLVPVSAGVRS